MKNKRTTNVWLFETHRLGRTVRDYVRASSLCLPGTGQAAADRLPTADESQDPVAQTVLAAHLFLFKKICKLLAVELAWGSWDSSLPDRPVERGLSEPGHSPLQFPKCFATDNNYPFKFFKRLMMYILQ